MKKHVKIIFSLIIALIIIGIMTVSKATIITETEIEEFINAHISMDANNITAEDIVAIYDEITEKYTNEDIADTIEQYSGELKESGIDEEQVKTITYFIRNTDTKALRNLLKNTDLNELQEKIEHIADTGDISELISGENAQFLIKLLLTNKRVRTSIIFSIIIAIYMIIVRWVIYKKAGKHGWAAIIPIYRKVVWLQVTGLSPWLLLFCLLPVIGWFILGIVFLISKFELPVKFGKSAAWGIGIWLCPVIFESVVAFSGDFQYIGEGKKTNND